MKINSYKKLKNGQYKIILSDRELVLHEDLILKNNLLITKELSEEQIGHLEDENKKYLIYDEALKYLKSKLRSKQEMYQYLEKKEYDKKSIDTVIHMLIKQKYLDDDLYVQAYINDKMHFTNDGPYKILKSLKQHNIDKKTIDQHLKSFSIELQKEKVEKFVQKAIKTNRNKSKKNLKQKIIYNLSNLGYSMDVIQSCLYLLEDVSDENIKKKEQEKLYAKLSKKYSGSELEYKIKQKMIQKGFY